MNELIARLMVFFVAAVSARLALAEQRRASGSRRGAGAGLMAPAKPEPSPLTAEQRRWARKAARNYARAQEKKWRRWNESMFETTK